MLSAKKEPLIDEENSLCVETTTTYGAIPSSDETSSRGDSDADERGSNHSSSVVKRKKRRMEQRQCCRPKVSTRLSNILPKRHACEEDRPTDLVLPALDPKYIH